MNDEPGAPGDAGGRVSSAQRPRSGRAVRVSSFPILMIAFVLLAAAAAAAAWGQFKPGKIGPVVSIGLSVAAILLAGVALWLRPRP